MTTRQTSVCVLILALIATFAWMGCDGDNATAPSQSGLTNDSPLAPYYPLHEGYVTTYEIDYANGNHSIETNETGHEVVFGGFNATEWIYRQSDARLDTSYFRVTDNAIYRYSSRNADPIKILEAPLTVGHSWSSYAINVDDEDDEEPVDSSGSGSKTEDKGDTLAIIVDGPGGFVTPLSGSAIMTIDGIEKLTLSDGSYYSGVIRVKAVGRAGVNDYYWFAAGVGLVRYALDVAPAAYPNGAITGELVQYATR